MLPLDLLCWKIFVILESRWAKPFFLQIGLHVVDLVLKHRQLLSAPNTTILLLHLLFRG